MVRRYFHRSKWNKEAEEITLKTLKDLQKDKGNCDSSEIRKEAVKRAKYFKKKSECFENFLYWKGRFDEVMEANNITEEDLK